VFSTLQGGVCGYCNGRTNPSPLLTIGKGKTVIQLLYSVSRETLNCYHTEASAFRDVVIVVRDCCKGIKVLKKQKGSNNIGLYVSLMLASIFLLKLLQLG
jgi:hypothetical protein